MSNFTDADIRASANGQSYSRGYEYYQTGAVSDLVRRGSLLTAQVQGSDYAPYDVAVTLAEDGGIADVVCTCPYDWGGYCKHVVAVLLKALNDQEDVTVKPDIEALLADLSEAQLRRLIGMLAEDQPKLVETVERNIRWLKMEPPAGAAASPPPASAIPVDLVAIRRDMHKEFRRVTAVGGGYDDRYWDNDMEGYFEADSVLEPHRELATRLLEAGDAARASDVIGVMIEEWGSGVGDLDEWIYEANEDMIAETQTDLGVLLAEALLSQELSPEQRAQWLARVEDWGKDLFDLEPAEVALAQWWDYPPLAAAMQGQISKKGAWEDEPPDFADELTQARLRILERQGRIQEYINLAEAEGQTSLYVNMLARSGQIEKAVAEARQYLSDPLDILALAQILTAQGQASAALAVAGHGLEAPSQGSKQALGRWTAALAVQQGDAALALQAAQTAFRSDFALADFRMARDLAGAKWPTVRTGLLAAMATSNHYQKAEIYLDEGMLVEAMAVIDREPYSIGLEQVIEAARSDYPDWGIGKCKRRAEAIMNAAKAKDYDRAVSWLSTARDIYLQHGRQAEWGAYLSGLLELHGRKYKLVPMLRGIR